MACPHVNVVRPEDDDLFRIHEVHKNVVPNCKKINVEYIITET